MSLRTKLFRCGETLRKLSLVSNLLLYRLILCKGECVGGGRGEEGGREGGRERGREGGREGGREEGREEGREGARRVLGLLVHVHVYLQ